MFFIWTGALTCLICPELIFPCFIPADDGEGDALHSQAVSPDVRVENGEVFTHSSIAITSAAQGQ